MGRGRAKAKQAKIAREIKYSAPSMDVEALQRELSDGQSSDGTVHRRPDSDDRGDAH
jgi:hypothetical protein